MKLSGRKHIIQKLRKGDREAFDDVYCTYRQSVFGIALRYLKDPQLAEDAVQELFVKLWMHRKNLDSEKSLEGFLYSTLKNHVLNMIKIRKRRIARQFEYARLNEGDHKEGSPEELIFYDDTDRIIQEGLQQLPDSKQLVFKLKRFEGYSNQEVAARLGISIHTVKSQFNRANRFLRKFVAARMDRG